MEDEPAELTAIEPEPDFMADLVSSLTADAPAVETPPVETPAATETTEADELDLGLDEPEKPETPAEEAPAAEEEVIPEVPKNRKDWDILRASRDRHKQSADEVTTILKTKDQTIELLNTQLQELQTKAAQLPELQEKLKDFDVYEKELAVTRLEATREYRETILRPLEVIGEQAAILAKSNETEEDRVYAMLREPDPVAQRAALKDITSGWDEMDRAELWNMTKDARVVLDKQDSLRENASAAAKEQQTLAAERERTEKEASRKEFTTQAKTVIGALKDKTPFIPLADGETADDRYLALEAKVSEVDFDSQSPRAKAFAAATAVLYPQMVKTLQKLQEEVTTLKTRVSQDNSSKAKVSPNQEVRAPSGEPEDFLAAMGVSQPNLSHGLNVLGG